MYLLRSAHSSSPRLTAINGGLEEIPHQRCPRTRLRLDLLDARSAAVLTLLREAALTAVYYGIKPEEVVAEVDAAVSDAP